MTKTVKVLIDGKPVEVPENTKIIHAAEKVGIKIPSLCYHPDLTASGSCGICVVDIEGEVNPKRACATAVRDGMTITTNTKRIRDTRKIILEMILADHETDCPTCLSNGKCELQDLANNFGIKLDRMPKGVPELPLDETSPSIIRNPNKCIACGRCIEVCSEIQTVNALAFVERGSKVYATTAYDEGMANSPCTNCGQCTAYCPTGALTEKSYIDQVWDAILDPEKHVIVQEAPAVRVALAEEFGMEQGLALPNKMYAALRRIGFDAVFDTNFSADLTIMEEGSELINRVTNNGLLPLITSCSPGWVKFMETFYPDMAGYVSTCKSPQQMFGALTKTYYSEQMGIDPKNIVSVSIMPCTAKKFEAGRNEMDDSAYRDVDYVITTREFVRMIKEAGIDFETIPEEKADLLMGEYTGAGTIFGASGGVMEAAVRSAYFLITGKNLANPEILPVRGLDEGIKEATIEAEGLPFPIKVAVAHGLGNARKLMERVQHQIQETGKSDYHFIEIMACPGGCVGGGGQPFGCGMADKKVRAVGLYEDDKNRPVRLSHENSMVTKIYKDFLGKPNSELAHKLLHTNYFQRSQSTGQVEKEVTHKHDHH